MLLDAFHFAYTVPDIDEAIDWYTGLLGFELVLRQRQDNPYTRTLVGYDDAVLEVAQLTLPHAPRRHSTHLLELVQYVTPRGSAVDLAPNNVGVAHIAFITEDIHGEFDRLAAHGVSFVNEPVAITAGANRGGFACYFRDLNGFPLELLQPPATDRRSRVVA
jgi:catechol 2,3-dioxygenase-like lactoylglutathione lyase family enzyme